MEYSNPEQNPIGKDLLIPTNTWLRVLAHLDIEFLEKDPTFAEIGLVIAVAEREIIGSAGFHDFPDLNGMIEIGFGIVPEKQNMGFGTELLHGMWSEIAKRTDVKILRYTVSPNNEPSLYIIKKLNFELVGEQLDSEDGLELIFELSVEKYLENFHS